MRKAVILKNKKQLLVIFAAFWLAILLFQPKTIYAGNGLDGSPLFLYGARPIGMANAFTAVVGDLNSVFFNPAGTAAIDRAVFNSFYNNPGQFSWYKQYLVSVGFPYKDMFTHSFSYTANDIDFNYSSIRELIAHWDTLYYLDKSFIYTLGLKISPSMFLGLNASYNSITSNQNLTAKGYGFDIGLLGKITEDFSLGAAIKNVYNRLKWSNNTNEDADMEYRIGAKFDIFNRLNLTSDLSATESEKFRTLNLGIEYIVWESVKTNATKTQRYFKSSDYYPENLAFIVRGGIEKDMYLDKDTRYSAGMSIGVGMTKVDYALKLDKNGMSKNNTQHYFSMGIEFGDKRKTDDVKEESVTEPPLPNNRVTSAASVKAPAIRQRRNTEIAVVNFKNFSNNMQFNWLTTGIPDMIIQSIKQQNNFNIKNRAEISQMVDMVTADVSKIDANTASQIGILVNADVVLVGSFELLRGNILKINYRLFDTDMRRELLSNSKQGNTLELFNLINQINSEINNVISSLGPYYTLK